MSWELGQGYLAEVSDGGARLFSLLSLDGILRKLTLDFRDIFSQGMFYTNLSGSVQVANGVATTNDTQMLGSAGNMEIKGTTNLVTEELNYQLTYAPKVTSSLPVILAWMVNPPSGLAALLIDKVLQDAEVISQLRYQVTGTISEPVVTEVDRNSRPVDIPEFDIPQEDQPVNQQTQPLLTAVQLSSRETPEQNLERVEHWLQQLPAQRHNWWYCRRLLAVLARAIARNWRWLSLTTTARCRSA